MEKEYNRFFDFIKKYLNPKFLGELDIEYDKNNFFVFANLSKSYLSNMSENEFKYYLKDINLYRFSFYKNLDYSLDRLYEHMDDSEKKEFRKIMVNLDKYNQNITKSMVGEILSSTSLSEKIGRLSDAIFSADTWKSTQKIAEIIDEVFNDMKFRQLIADRLMQYLESHKKLFGIDWEKKFKIFVSEPEDFMIDIVSTAIRVNPKISIYTNPTSLNDMKSVVESITDESVFLFNIKKRIDINFGVNNKKLPEYKANFKFIKNPKDINERPLKNINVSNIITDPVNYSTNQFIEHITAFILKGIELFVAMKYKNTIHDTLHEFRDIMLKEYKTNNKSLLLEMKEYINKLIIVIVEGDMSEFDNLKIYCKSHIDEISDTLYNSKKYIISLLENKLQDFGAKISINDLVETDFSKDELTERLNYYLNESSDDLIRKLLYGLHTAYKLLNSFRSKKKVIKI